MSDLKYVMLSIQNDTLARKVPIIFPDFMVHEDIAKDNIERLKQMDIKDGVSVSAGYIRFGIMGAECYGESETLKLSANEKDALIINTYPYSFGLISYDN